MEPPPIDPYQAPKSTQVAGLAPTQQDYIFREMKTFAWLAAKIGTLNPMNNWLSTTLGVPIQRPQLPISNNTDKSV